MFARQNFDAIRDDLLMNATFSRNQYFYDEMKITKDITIEDLVRLKVAAVRYLSEKGIKCIACGEPVWGTLEEAAREKGFGDEEIETFVADLNNL